MPSNKTPNQQSRKRSATSPAKSSMKKRITLRDTNNNNSAKILPFTDAADEGNLYEAPEYAFDIFEYMRSREQKFVIKSDFLALNDVTPRMRSILVDWMVEVQGQFQLNHETLYLAVKLVDLYLQKVDLKREKLQLLGASSLLIAAKFDESYIPCVDDYLFICEDAYKRSELLAMERSILSQIGFDINVPISYRFLRRFAKCTRCGMTTLTLARFILESSLQSYIFVDRSASKIAAAALWLALKITNKQQWDDTLVYYSSYAEEDIIDLAYELNMMIKYINNSSFNAILTKYSSSVFYKVASNLFLPAEVEFQCKRRSLYFEI